MRSVRIAADRVGTLIGNKGETKRMLMRIAGVTMEIDTEEGDVILHDDKAKDPLKALQLLDVIKAIGRGFSPERAMRLFSDDEYLEVIDLKEFGGRPNQMSRIRGRLIGHDGKTRTLIEDLAGVSMSIYGNTVAIIGSSAGLPVAKHAVELLLNGSEHSTVYRYLEGQRPNLRIAEMGFDI